MVRFARLSDTEVLERVLYVCKTEGVQSRRAKWAHATGLGAQYATGVSTMKGAGHSLLGLELRALV